MKTISNSTALVLTALFGLIIVSQGVLSEEEESSTTLEFVGGLKCKICHNKAESGQQFAVWSKVPHSQAYAALATPKAKEVATKLGIEDPQKSGKCLKCHSTAYFFTEQKVTNIALKKDGSPRLAVEEGVSCESCHWAGSLYQPKKVMESFEASLKAGMNPHPEESCVKCHNKDNPNWDPQKYTLKDGTKAGFDFDQAFEKIKHPNPLMAAARAKRKAETKK